MVWTFEVVGLFEMVGSSKVIGAVEEEVGFKEIVKPAGVVCKPETEGVLRGG